MIIFTLNIFQEAGLCLLGYIATLISGAVLYGEFTGWKDISEDNAKTINYIIIIFWIAIFLILPK